MYVVYFKQDGQTRSALYLANTVEDARALFIAEYGACEVLNIHRAF